MTSCGQGLTRNSEGEGIVPTLGMTPRGHHPEGRGLNIGMPQMLLDSPEIAMRSAQKLDASRMTEGMWMKLGKTGLLAQRLELARSADSFAIQAPDPSSSTETQYLRSGNLSAITHVV